MATAATAPADGDLVGNDKKYRQVTEKDRMCIFYAIRSTMVKDRPKRGIFQNSRVNSGLRCQRYSANGAT